MAERDSLNAAILAPDAAPGTPEFDLLHQGSGEGDDGEGGTEMHRDPPRHGTDPPMSMRSSRRCANGSPRCTIGNPELDSVRMGPLVGLDQRRDVLAHVAKLRTEAELVSGDPDHFAVEGADAARGAFVPPLLLHCADPAAAISVHEIEAFGPVCHRHGLRRAG